MADRPTKVPEWATGPGADVVEPPEAKKEIGWQQGEKPPAGYFNWLFALLTRWIAWFAQEIKGRTAGGIEVPGGVLTKRLVADGGPGATEASLLAQGRGVDAPGGEFVGNGPLIARSQSGVLPAVRVEVDGSATGPALTLTRAHAGIAPSRGLFHLGSQLTPAAPLDGDIYRSPGTGGGLYLRRGGQWVPIVLPSSETARVVVGDPGAPKLGDGWEVLPTDVHEAPAFYFDGRRVWLSGFVRRNGYAAKTMFTLPVGRRPGRMVGFYGVTGRPEVWISISDTGEVQTENVLENDVPVLFDVSLHGLSFEVAS